MKLNSDFKQEKKKFVNAYCNRFRINLSWNIIFPITWGGTAFGVMPQKQQKLPFYNPPKNRFLMLIINFKQIKFRSILCTAQCQ